MENGGSQQVDPKVSEMESKLKEMEYEKNNIEYTLSRRQDEYMQLNETLLKTKEELEQQTKDYESVVTRSRQQDSELQSIRSTLLTTLPVSQNYFRLLMMQ